MINKNIETERFFRLEFNEKQQCFHLDNYNHEEGSHGWFTIYKHCTNHEFHIYEAYVNRIPHKILTKEYLLKCAKELKGFINNLSEYKLTIDRRKP
jgi:hypothetical protein